MQYQLRSNPVEPFMGGPAAKRVVIFLVRVAHSPPLQCFNFKGSLPLSCNAFLELKVEMPNPSHPNFFVRGNQYKISGKTFSETMTYTGKHPDKEAYKFRGKRYDIDITPAQLFNGTYTVEPVSLDPGSVNNSDRIINSSSNPKGGGRRRRTRRKTAKSLRRRRG